MTKAPYIARRWPLAELLFWIMPIAAPFVFPQFLVLGSQILITALFAMSLDLIMGYAGMVSLGHAAFFGLGAYGAGLMANHGMGDPLLGLLVAALVASMVGFLVSFLVLRGHDLARLMVTLGVGLMLYEAANKASWLTGGVDGLSGMQITRLLGWRDFDLEGRLAYGYSLVVLFLIFLFLRRLVRSPFGLALKGIRENARRMPAIGTPVTRRLVTAFTISAAIAGVAGALLAETTQFVGLDTLNFERSAEVLIMLVLGGTGRLYGAIVGAAIFMVAQDRLAGINPVYWQFWLGVLLVAIVMAGRGGVLGVWDRIVAQADRLLRDSATRSAESQ
jgi:branched-chain amino acid transport system permease protein